MEPWILSEMQKWGFYFDLYVVMTMNLDQTNIHFQIK